MVSVVINFNIMPQFTVHFYLIKAFVNKILLFVYCKVHHILNFFFLFFNFSVFPQTIIHINYV